MRNNVNLLPASFRRQQMVRNRIYQWSALISVVLLIGWGSHWYELREQQSLEQRLDVLEREHQPTQVMLRQLVAMRQKLVDLEQQEHIASELEHQRHALTLLGVISQTTSKTNGKLRVTKMDLTNFQSPSSDQAVPSTTNEQFAGFHLEGVSLDNPSVTELIDGLEKSGIFSHVELLTVTEKQESDLTLRHYEVRCDF